MGGRGTRRPARGCGAPRPAPRRRAWSPTPSPPSHAEARVPARTPGPKNVLPKRNGRHAPISPTAGKMSDVRIATTGNPAVRAGSGVEHDRHRPVVFELDDHARPEDAGLDRDAFLAERGAEALVEGLGLLRPRGRGEARTVALRCVG